MRKALKDLFFYLFAGGLSRLLPILILPYVAVKLGQTDFGVFILFQLYLSLASVIILLGLEQAVFRKIPETENVNQQNRIIGTSLYFILCTSILIIILFSIFNNYINIWLFDGNLNHPVWLVAGFALIMSTDVLLVTKYKAEKKSAFYFRLLLIRSFIFFILMLVLLEFGFRLDAYFIALFISEIIALMLMYSDIRDGFRAGYSTTVLKQLIQYGLPLSGVGFVLLLIYQFDHYLIKELFGVEQTGIYSYAYKFAAVIGTFVLIVNNVWLPRLFEKGQIFAQTYLKEYASLLMIISGGALLSLITAFHVFPSALIPQGFENTPLLLTILGIGYLFYAHGQILDSMILQDGRTFPLFLYNLTVLIMNIVLNLIFLRRYGLNAAAVITALSYLILWGCIVGYLAAYHRGINLWRIVVEGLVIVIPFVILLWTNSLVLAWILLLIFGFILIRSNKQILSRMKTILP